MNPTSKKFISLFLVFSLVMLSANLYAKERRGAKLIIIKKGRQQIRGELITVKPNSLLLLNSEGKDVSVDIADIRVIKIVRKLGFWKGAGYGALTGAFAGYIFGNKVLGSTTDFLGEEGPIVSGLFYGVIGLLIGGVAGGVHFVSIKDKVIGIRGMSDSEIQRIMDKLRKKARIRDY